MKRTLAALLAAALSLSLVSCGGGGGGTSQGSGSGEPSSSGDTAQLTATQQIIQQAQGMTMEELAQKYVGRPVLRDHNWSAAAQTARVYAGSVEPGEEEGVRRLVLRCYMPRSEQTAPTIAAIESGILRECSLGLSVKRALCSICGANQRETLCKHIQGREYDGQVCHMDLDGAADAYEVSMVAVPAQPAAGVIKSKRYGGQEPAPKDENQVWRDEALLELEKNRF